MVLVWFFKMVAVVLLGVGMVLLGVDMVLQDGCYGFSMCC